MAGSIIILGSVLGFLSGVFGYFAVDLSLFSAIAIWAVSGPLSLLFAVLLNGPRAALNQPEPEAA